MFTSQLVEDGLAIRPSQDAYVHRPSLPFQTPPRQTRNVYIPAVRHPAETERLTALRSYDILDTPVEAAFDDLTRLASIVCNTPIAMISLIEDKRVWLKSAFGMERREVPFVESLCPHTLHAHGLFEVRDTRTDPRFKLHPDVVGGPEIRFYAAAVLRTSDGLPLGTICVLDHRPRRLSEKQRSALACLARQVMAQMEFRRERIQHGIEHARRNDEKQVTGHDLKQPLQVMVMALDRMRNKVIDTQDRSRLAYAIDAGFRMSKQVDQFTASQTAHGEQPRLRSFPIAILFTTISNTWAASAKAKGIELAIVPSSAHVVSDPGMLRLLIGNLVANAIKYTSAGRVLLGVRRRGGSLSIEVHDTGAGIPAEKLGIIHDPFFKIDPETEGLGLGLSIVRQSADRLDHKISMRSQLACGTRVTVTVPEAASRS